MMSSERSFILAAAVLTAALLLLSAPPSSEARALRGSTATVITTNKSSKSNNDGIMVASSSSSPCAVMGSINLFNMSVDTCEEFHTGDVAISLPDDTDFVKYGDIFFITESEACHFNDRSGAMYPFSSDLLGYVSEIEPLNATTSMMVFKAEFNTTSKEREIVALTLVLFIDQRAMMRPFMGLSFIGRLINSGQPSNVLPNYWFRWDFSDTLIMNGPIWFLEGSFVNLNEGVMDSSYNTSTQQEDIVCRPALVTDEASAKWFHDAVGSETNIKSYWYSDMHAPLDSEFVPRFPNTRSFMAHLPTPSKLLSTNVQVDSYAFLTHANPMVSLHYFVGNFSRQLPPVRC